MKLFGISFPFHITISVLVSLFQSYRHHVPVGLYTRLIFLYDVIFRERRKAGVVRAQKSTSKVCNFSVVEPGVRIFPKLILDFRHFLHPIMKNHMQIIINWKHACTLL